MEYILLLLGFVLLILGGRFLVTGSVALSTHLKISKLVIGVTVVSFGTSAPEMFVSCMAAINNHADVSIGNVVGSNVANIALVLALTAIVFPIPVRSSTIKFDATFLIIVSGLFYVFILNSNLARYEGIVFLLLLISYSIFIIKKSRKADKLNNVEFEVTNIPVWQSLLMIIGATLGLAFGSDLLVKNASLIALNFGVPERVIAITLVAFGTSLPELATSLIAAFKKEMDISIGNIIGSNIFNILAVLGVASTITEINVAEKFIRFDIYWMIGISLFLVLTILPVKKGKLTRIEGVILFLVYCIYLYFLFSER